MKLRQSKEYTSRATAREIRQAEAMAALLSPCIKTQRESNGFRVETSAGSKTMLGLLRTIKRTLSETK